jgi:hypothetical protein
MTIKKYETHAEWLADRRASTLLGATDAAAIMGEAFGRGPWDVWLDKRDPAGAREVEPTVQMRLGLAAEPWALEWLAQRADIHPSLDILPGPWAIEAGPLRASPDALVALSGHHVGIVEVKTSAPWNRDKWAANGTICSGPLADWPVYPCPPGYLWQVMTQAAAMLVGGGLVEGLTPAVYLVAVFLEPVAAGLVLADDLPPVAVHEVRVIEINFDAADLRDWFERLTRWHQRHIVEGVEPPRDGSDACRRWHLDPSRFPRSEVREATADEAARIAAILDARAAEAASEAQRRPQEAELIAMMGTAKTVRSPAGKATISANGRLTITASKQES